MPNLFVIAGCNGAGKTTAAFTLLPEIINCKEFVNADEIARGISPFQPEKVSIEASRLMLHRLNELLLRKEDFAFETTLSSKNYINFILKAKEIGYEICLIYFYLDTIELAISRIKERVKKGGHFIDDKVVNRRYKRSLVNLATKYSRIVDYWIVYNNSGIRPLLIAELNKPGDCIVHDYDVWNKIISYENK